MRGRVVQIVFARDVNSACADVFVGVCDWCVCGRVGCVCGCECVNCFVRVCGSYCVCAHVSMSGVWIVHLHVYMYGILYYMSI